MKIIFKKSKKKITFKEKIFKNKNNMKSRKKIYKTPKNENSKIPKKNFLTPNLNLQYSI